MANYQGVQINAREVHALADEIESKGKDYDSNMAELYKKFNDLANNGEWNDQANAKATDLMNANKKVFERLGECIHEIARISNTSASNYEDAIARSARQFNV